MNLPVPTRSHEGWVGVEAPQRPVLFVNPWSGGGRAADARLADAARERGIEPVVLTPGAKLAALVEEAVGGGADALGMAGGDGSLAVVASAAVVGVAPVIARLAAAGLALTIAGAIATHLRLGETSRVAAPLVLLVLALLVAVERGPHSL